MFNLAGRSPEIVITKLDTPKQTINTQQASENKRADGGSAQVNSAETPAARLAQAAKPTPPASQPASATTPPPAQQTATEVLVSDTVFEKPKKAVNCRGVWGKVLLSLRKNNIINVHSICVEISDLEICDNDFIINVHNKINFEVLKKPQNYGELVDTFSKLGYNYNVILNFVPKEKLKKIDKSAIIGRILGCTVAVKVKK